MLWSVGFNAVLGLIMVITVCFCLGDVTSVLASPTGNPMLVSSLQRRHVKMNADFLISTQHPNLLQHHELVRRS